MNSSGEWYYTPQDDGSVWSTYVGHPYVFEDSNLVYFIGKTCEISYRDLTDPDNEAIDMALGTIKDMGFHYVWLSDGSCISVSSITRIRYSPQYSANLQRYLNTESKMRGPL